MAKATGTAMFIKHKTLFEKPAVSKKGESYTRVTLMGLHEPGDGQRINVFISTPQGYTPPPLVENEYYTIPVTIRPGGDRALFVNLSTHMSITPAPGLDVTGTVMFIQFKATFEKPAVSKTGESYTRVTLMGLHEPGDGQRINVFISTPQGYKPPPLVENEHYAVPVTIRPGGDRALFVNLSTHMPIAPAPDLD